MTTATRRAADRGDVEPPRTRPSVDRPRTTPGVAALCRRARRRSGRARPRRRRTRRSWAGSTPSPGTVTTDAAWSGAPSAVAAARRRGRRAGAGAATVLTAAGDAWAAKAGGTSGRAVGRGAGSARPDARRRHRATLGQHRGRRGARRRRRISALGKAEPGDKTMLDALLPFADALDSGRGAGAPLVAAWAAAAEAAVQPPQDTAGCVPGRPGPAVGRAEPRHPRPRSGLAWPCARETVGARACQPEQPAPHHDD